jgi:hypothetical protein
VSYPCDCPSLFDQKLLEYAIFSFHVEAIQAAYAKHNTQEAVRYAFLLTDYPSTVVADMIRGATVTEI